MRIFLALITTFIFTAGFSQEIKLASDLWPPFTSSVEDQAIAIDLVEEALSRAGITSSTDIIEFSDVITGVKEGIYDGSAALWLDTEREEILKFSIPYLHNQLVLVGKKGSIVAYTNVKGLKGKRVAIVETYAYGEAVDDEYGVRFVRGTSDQDNLEKLLRGEVDYMLVDALMIQYQLKYQREAAIQFLEIGNTPILTKSLHFGIDKNFNDADYIIAKFNEEIIKMAEDGTYNEVLKLNWIRTDIDGDGKAELVLNGDKAGQEAPTSSYDVYFQKASQFAATDRYYIEGQVYQGWDNVPAKYKAAPQTADAQSRSELLRWKF